VTSLLLPVGAKDTWQGMKTVGELKHEKGIKNTVNTDHLYRVCVLHDSHELMKISFVTQISVTIHALQIRHGIVLIA
jgi:hypothetical protein